MRKKYSIEILSLIGVSAFLLCGIYAFPTHAQVNEPLIDEASESDFTEPYQANMKFGEQVSCFDYVPFGSVKISMQQDITEYAPGDPILMHGSVTNTTNFPLREVDILARVVKNNPTGSGVIILDEFMLEENSLLQSGEVKEISYSYLPGFNAPAGEYTVHFFVYMHDKFTLSGNPSIITGGEESLSFRITGQNPDHIFIDQGNVLINGQPLDNLNQHPSSSSIFVQAPLVNPSSKEKTMRVTYTFYRWNSLDEKAVLDTYQEEVTVSANQTRMLEYIPDQATAPAYELLIHVEPATQTQDESVFREKSMARIKFSFDDLSQTTLRFVGLASYPLYKGEEATLVTCAYNAPDRLEGFPPFSKVETVLYDENGRELSRIEFDGILDFGVVGMKSSFIPKTNFSQLTIESRVFDTNDTLVDSFTTTYDCQEINSEYCIESKTSATRLMIIGGLILILLIGWVVYRRKKRLTI